VHTWSRLSTALVLVPSLLTGCGGGSSPDPGATAGQSPTAPTDPADPAAGELGGRLSNVINQATTRYRPLDYEYDEDLLKILDQVEARLSGKLDKFDKLPMPRLDEAEQLDHFRETVRRWSAKTDKNLRAEIDPLKAEVAARKPGGPPFHPEFHKKFSAAFDEFIPIEVAEIRERRNRYIHEKARPILDEYRAKSADAVKAQEDLLNQPPYNLPAEPAPPPAPEKTGK
jgi:hypothetical protein